MKSETFRRRRQLLALVPGLALASALAGCGEEARSTLPALPFTQLDGGRHQLGDLKGQVMVINFWAAPV